MDVPVARDQLPTPHLLPRGDAAAAYRLVYSRIDALLRGRTDVSELTVPACPDWSVRQTVAHLAGLAQDVASANLDGLASAAWTQAHLDRFAHNSIEELLDVWAESMGPLTTVLAQSSPEFAAGQSVFDVLTHEHDIRGAIGQPGSRSGDLGYQVALGFLTTAYDVALRASGTTAMQLTTPSLGGVQLGDPDTASEQLALELSDFEALRAFGGRRSLGQLAALPWRGEPPRRPPAARNDAIRPPEHDLVE